MSGFTITGSMTFSGGFDIPFPPASPPSTVDYLVVAGGGGGTGSGNGGGVTGGGGGAGGVIIGSGLSVTAGTSYPVVVGSGGAAGIVASLGTVRGASGIDSTFGSTILVAKGGGGGGYYTTGANGGSGGGGGYGDSGYSASTATQNTLVPMAPELVMEMPAVLAQYMSNTLTQAARAAVGQAALVLLRSRMFLQAE